MKCYIYILIVLATFINAQDRSVIFNTGSPDGSEGYTIDSNNTIANRITINNDYVLEAMAFYMRAETFEESNITISIRQDNNGLPGDLVSELSEWEHQIDLLHPTSYNLIVTTDLCIYLDGGNTYWWQISASDEFTNAIWIHSNSVFYTYASSIDGGNLWTIENGNAGAGGVWAEQIYETSIQPGDVNSDFMLNILDIVAIVGYIMDTNTFDDEEFGLADLNHDGIVNVVDVVQLVNNVLAPFTENPNFSLEDINPASEYYGQNIGPSFYDGQVSCYYFGKQG